MKQLLFSLLIFLCITQFSFAENVTSLGQTPSPTTPPTFIQDIISKQFGDGKVPLNTLFNQLFYIGLIAAVALAIIMIIRGGVEYMTIDSISGKENGKKRVQAALGGLVLAFGAIMILKTINPGLTSFSFSFQPLQTIQDLSLWTRPPDSLGGNTSGSSQLGNASGTVTAKMTDTELRNYTLQKIKEMGFSQLNPSDKAAFFPNGGTDEEWLGLASAMMKYESNFNPNETYTENFKDKNGNNVVSTGLFQLSQESLRGYGLNLTTDQLKDSQTNIDAGLTVLKTWVEKDGVISGPGNTGGARYWSVLRSSGKLNDVRNEMTK